MNTILADIGQMLSVMVVAMVIVLIAMIIDLVSGINKARQNGIIRSSWGLKRTMSKFIMYEGGLLIAAGVDILMHSSHLYDLLHLHADPTGCTTSLAAPTRFAWCAVRDLSGGCFLVCGGVSECTRECRREDQERICRYGISSQSSHKQG